MNKDMSQSLQQTVEQAISSKTALNISAGNTKQFYGRQPVGEILDISEHCGIVSYEPTELVITSRAGTPLKDIEAALASEHQILGFEPPAFGDTATIGGTIACNLSGPRRAYSGAARDFVLGSKIINGKAEILHFGGEVMKNVAGYDVSRLMCGAMGTLGVLLECSIKVLPKPETELTLVQEMDVDAALSRLHHLARQALPISASCFDDNCLHIRLSGSQGTVQAARKIIGGDELASGDKFWHELKEQQLTYFESRRPLWRLSLASNTPVLDIPGKWLYEWNGAQRWLITDEDETAIRHRVAQSGGHAVCFRHHADHHQVFHPLEKGLLKIHRQLKQAFDPAGIFNPGRMYSEL
ncbi:MAG: glycolate oxidase subunit GlcE [Gammaproteobacteria bacterium]|nr:MAG: glycolate oxidase subunit GlcE [Gammaproteobacteria bacterium]